MEGVVVQSDRAEGELHGSTCYPFIDDCTKGRTKAPSQCSVYSSVWWSIWESVYVTFVLSVDVVTDMQVQVCDLEVVGCFAHVVGTEQLCHSGILVSSRGRLLHAHLLG